MKHVSKFESTSLPCMNGPTAQSSTVAPQTRDYIAQLFLPIDCSKHLNRIHFSTTQNSEVSVSNLKIRHPQHHSTGLGRLTSESLAISTMVRCRCGYNNMRSHDDDPKPKRRSRCAGELVSFISSEPHSPALGQNVQRSSSPQGSSQETALGNSCSGAKRTEPCP